MKRKIFILSAACALLALVTGCADEIKSNQLEELQVSNAYVSITPAGGSNTITVTSTAPWSFVDDNGINTVPDWLTVEPTSGSAGTTTVTFTGTASESYRTADLKIQVADKEQYVYVRQGTDAATEATIAEALTVADGKKLQLTGAVSGYYSNAEKYGNVYITDDTGTILIYGMADKDGNFANNPLSSWGIEMGDIITVVGPRGSYKGSPQMVDVTVLKVVKSLIKITGVEEGTIPQDGGEKKVYVVCKGNGPAINIPDEAQSWLSVSDVSMIPGVPDPQFPTVAVPDTTVVTFKALANEGGARSSVVTLSSSADGNTSSITTEIGQDGSIKEITCADFNALADGNALYKVTGIVSDIVMDKNDPTKYNVYGNFYINDATGKIYVYGLLPEAGGATKQDVLTKKGIKAGDIITVVGPKGSYKGSPQMVNAYYVSHSSVNVTDVAGVNAGNDGDYFQVTGTVTKIDMDKNDNTKPNKYGNFYIKDDSGELYIYGIYSKAGKLADNPIQSWGIEVGDEVTVNGPKSTYKTTVELKDATVVKIVKGSGSGDEGGDEGGSADVLTGTHTLTDANLPTKYPTEEATFTQDGVECYILNVANYGSGIQIKKETGYIANKTPFKKITKVVLVWKKNFYPENIKVYAGTEAKPSATVIEGTTDSDSMTATFDFSGGSYTYFNIANTSTYATYLESVTIVSE